MPAGTAFQVAQQDNRKEYFDVTANRWKDEIGAPGGTKVTIQRAGYVQFQFGDGSTTSFTLTHNLGNQYPTVTLWDTVNSVQVQTEIKPLSTTQIQVNFASAPVSNQMILGVTG